MPDAPRKSRPLARHRDVYTEDDGIFGRIADLVIENPARSGGFVAMLLVTGAIVTNAAFFQTARHPDPFFVTRETAPANGATIVPKSSEPGKSLPAAEMTAVPASERLDASPVPDAAPAASVESAAPAAAMEPMPALPKSRPSAPAAARTTTTSQPATEPALTSLVADTQRALADSHYYSGPVDGILGPATHTAISNFEMKIGLIPTGQPSPKLLQQIRKGYPAIAAPNSTDSVGPASDVRLKRIQHALNEIGYGPLPEDGLDGAKTAAAIRRFEADNRLPVTGRAGDAVNAKLVLIGAMPQN